MTLLAVITFPGHDELEVHLLARGERAVGRTSAGTSSKDAADATADALAQLGVDVAVDWARLVQNETGGRTVVTVRVAYGDDTLFGVASASTPAEAGARATLDALNRRLTRPDGDDTDGRGPLALP